MCRLRTNFARLGDPLQGLHKGKTGKPGWRPLEMHPFCLRHLSTGKHVTGFSGHYRPPTNPVTRFPLGERWCVSTKRGAFPSPARAVGMFSHRRKPGCKGFIVPPLQWRGRWWHQPPKGESLKWEVQLLLRFIFLLSFLLNWPPLAATPYPASRDFSTGKRLT